MRRAALALLSSFMVCTFLSSQTHTATVGVDTAWVRHYGSGISSWDDYLATVVVDASGNVYVTGGSGGDYATIKYNSNGDTLWVRRYNGPGNYLDQVSSLAVDESGHVYVTGRSDGSGTSADYATIKYNSDGDTIWVRRYNGPGNGGDRASSLAVDANENVYVTGRSEDSGTSADYATIKYNSNGDELWVRRYNGPGNGWDNASSLAIDGSGNVYVTGESADSDTSAGYATIKYNSNGDELWVRRYKGGGASCLVVDGNGNVYVTGESYGEVPGNWYDYATIKYNSNGDTLWVRRYNGPGNSWDDARSLAIDGSGNVYVTGDSWGSVSDDYATIKYNSNGDTLWVRRYTSMEDEDIDINCATSLAVDVSGNVYVTGEIVSIRYDNMGNEDWVVRYSNGGQINSPFIIKVDPSGNVYVGGTSFTDNGSVYTVIKYVQTPTSVDRTSEPLPTDFAIEQNYPNPFNPTTEIRYQMSEVRHVRLSVFDVLGREVAVLVNEEKPPGNHTVPWNAAGFASGIYLVRMQAGEFTQTRKLVLMR